MPATDTNVITPARRLPLRPLIEGPSAWIGADMRKRESEWSYRLSPPEIAEIETAGKAVQARGLEIVNIRREDFPLPTLGPTLERMRAEVLDGRGFILLLGMPVEDRPIAESATAYWGIGTYVGGARSQSAQGHLLGHVYDFAGGLSATNPNLRSYATAERQNFHIDRCDVVALLCLRRAKSGGLSSIISSMTVHNTMAAIMAAIMAARRPDLLDRLYQPFAVDRRGEVPEGKAPFYEAPVFNEHAGYLSVLYSRLHIGSAQRFPDARRLTAEDTEALDMFGELAGDPELRLDMNFMPGDIQFLHNHTILHARSAYEDWPKVERKRHLLRLWLAPQAPGRFHRSSRNATPTSRSEIAAASSARELVCTYCWRRARTSRRRLGWGDGRSAARAGSPKHLQSSSSATVRQTHIDGDKLCQIRWRHVPATIDRLTGNTGPAHIFVRRHGRTNFTYAEASWTQALADWIGAHTRAFAAIGGVTHYDTAILTGWAAPAARDKTKVEVAVPVIERWLLGSLRHRRFYSLAELNAAIGELLRQLNVGRRIRVVPLRSWL